MSNNIVEVEAAGGCVSKLTAIHAKWRLNEPDGILITLAEANGKLDRLAYHIEQLANMIRAENTDSEIIESIEECGKIGGELSDSQKITLISFIHALECSGSMTVDEFNGVEFVERAQVN